MKNDTLTILDHEIAVSDGNLFARCWQPQGLGRDLPTLVLFHDSLGSVELWRDFPASLASKVGLPVVAYDRLGFGRSDPNPRQLNRDFMAEEARTSFTALREQLGIERFITFGHSVGGAMAVAAAALTPEACSAVITESTQAFVEDRTLAGIRAAKAQFSAADQMERLARYHGEKALWVLDAWIETWLAPGFADWTLDAQLARIRCPLLAMHGDRDEFGSDAHVDRIVSHSAGPATRIFFDDCGHVPHREYPASVLDAVNDFLANDEVGRKPPLEGLPSTA